MFLLQLDHTKDSLRRTADMFLLIMRTALTHIEDYTGSVPADLKEKNQQ
jgi:hypothetical protein